MGELGSALDGLAAEDLHAFGRALLDRIRALRGGPQPARRRAGPHVCGRRDDPGRRARRAEDDGVLAARARPAAPPAAAGRGAPGRALERLPAVAAAFAAGRSPPTRWP